MSEHLVVPVETRASADGPRLYGVILQEGRAARGGRAELFAPQSAVWPSDGIGLLLQHHGATETRAVPERAEHGEIRISAPATPAIFRAVQAGKRYLSVEFHAERETRTAGGVREIERALIVAAALTDDPEYHQARAEVRTRRRRRHWL